MLGKTKATEQSLAGLDRIITSSIKIAYSSTDTANVKQAQENLQRALALRLKIKGIEVPTL